MLQDLRAYRGLLSNRSFVLYIFSYYLTNFGSIMTMFALWSQVTAVTANDPMALGTATILTVLPGILIAPWAGLMADRMSKRTILLTCHLTRAGLVGLMFLSTELWQLYTLALLHSAVGAFAEPPHRALLPLLVKREQYITMNAFLAMLNNILQLLRPSLAGLVVAAFGYKAGFAIDFFTYFLSAIALLFVNVRDRTEERRSDGASTGMWQEVREGVAYIRTEPILVYIFVFMMLFTLAMGMQGPLTMVFVGEHLTTVDQASKLTGYLFASLGIGGLLGALITPRLVKKVPLLLLLFVSLAFDGAVVIAFSQADSFAFALTCFALFGIIGSVNQIAQDTIIQTIVPEHMRGRVYGAFGPITGPITLLSIGAGTSLAAVTSTRFVFLLAGLLEFLAVIVCRLLPTYKQVRTSLAERVQAEPSPAAAPTNSTP